MVVRSMKYTVFESQKMSLYIEKIYTENRARIDVIKFLQFFRYL